MLVSSAVFPNGERSGGGGGGCHLSLAKMDSAPSSSVVGLHGINSCCLGGGGGGGGGLTHHLMANSEASLLKINHHHDHGCHGLTAAARKSLVGRIPPRRSGSSEVNQSKTC